MKQILKISAMSAFLLSFAISFTSCVKKIQVCEGLPMHFGECWDIFGDFLPDESASIIGKWRFVRSIGSGAVYHQCLDYSHCNIVWEFDANGTLTMSGRQISEHKPGIHSFSLIDNSTGIFELYINKSQDPRAVTFYHDIMVMITGNVTLTGFYDVFIRINQNNQ